MQPVPIPIHHKSFPGIKPIQTHTHNTNHLQRRGHMDALAPPT